MSNENEQQQAAPQEEQAQAETPTSQNSSSTTEGTPSAAPEGAKPEGSLLSQQPAPEPLAVTDLKMPEGLTLDEPTVKEFVDLLNKEDLSTKDRAQALVDLQAKVAQAAAKAAEDEWAAKQEEMKAEVAADPEIGGANQAAVLGGIAKMLQQYPEAEALKAQFEFTGLGNSVVALKFLNWVAKQLNEGTPASGTPASAGQATLAEKLYPSLAKQG